MSKKNIEKIKNDLLERKATIEKEISQKDVLVGDHQEANFADANDLATHDTDMANDLNVRNKKISVLKEINETLDMIANGTYGVCDECGADISIKRLEAYPTSKYCISCKEDFERKNKMKSMITNTGTID